MAINYKLIEIFVDIFDLTHEQVTFNLNKDDVVKWDSLAQMELVTALECKFEIDLKIEELNTETIIKKLEDNSIDCAIAATPLNNDKILERPLYYEPFVAYVPKHHHLSGNKYLEVDDLSNGDLLILKDGHCFRNQVLNLCTLEDLNKQYELKSGSFETLINLSNNGPWMTIIPYLHSNNLSQKNIENIIPFQDPAPAREVSMIYSKSQLKLPVINALMSNISSVIRGQIKYNDIKIMSPVSV